MKHCFIFLLFIVGCLSSPDHPGYSKKDCVSSADSIHQKVNSVPPPGQPIHPKPLSLYKVSFVGLYGEYSYDYRIDTVRNTIEEVTDSIDIPMFDYIMRKNALGDTVDRFTAEFERFYLTTYRLLNDSFSICRRSVHRSYDRPLVISQSPYDTRLDTNAALSLTEFPAISVYENRPLNERFTERADMRRKSPTNQISPIDTLLADTILDLNSDNVFERISVYYSEAALTNIIVIDEKDSTGWNRVQQIPVFLLYTKYIRFYTLSFHGKHDRAFVINTIDWDPTGWSYVPPLRSWEQIAVFMPEN